MKKNTKKTTKPEIKSPIGSTFVRTGPLDRRLAAAQDGKNCHYGDMKTLDLGKMLLQNYTTFTVNDFMQITGNLDVPYQERKQFFDAFVSDMQAQGRIRSIPSCDSIPLFRVC